MSIGDVAHAAHTTAETFDGIVIGMESGAEVLSAGGLRDMGRELDGSPQQSQ
ncbi:MAG: hypothetical protein ACRDGB_14140 [Candidatus Limnocylindria bacterium]